MIRDGRAARQAVTSEREIEVVVEILVEDARRGSPESLGFALEACRPYLVRIASEELAPELRAKGDASDLVQETFLDATRDFRGFTGRTAAEWRAWLRQIFFNNLHHLARRFRHTGKR